MRSAIRPMILLSALLLALVIGACGDEESDGQATVETVAAGTATVTMEDILFEPERLEVEAGTTVTWINEDNVEHNVIEANDLFRTDDFGEGGTFEFTFDTAGTYNYVCTLHPPDMKGQIVVREAGS